MRDLVKHFIAGPAALEVVCADVIAQIRALQRDAGLPPDAPLESEPGGDALAEVINNVVHNWCVGGNGRPYPSN